MPLASDQLVDIRRHLDKAVAFEHLTRLDWRRQTDAVQVMFYVARLFSDLGEDAIFIDGCIDDHVKRMAVEAAGGVKGFFNRRFHDLGFKWRRVLFFDTCGTRKMEGRGSGRHKLHFHAVLQRPPGWSDADMKRLLGKTFGCVPKLGRRQFHLSRPRWDQHHTHNSVQIAGPLGKVAYVLTHAGTTYENLGLNGGKRSRRAPATRGSCNRSARGLARGIPSNFVADVTFCDLISKRAGREAFEAWVKAERAQRRPVASALEIAARKPKRRNAG